LPCGAYDQPALGGVYKLGAVQDASGQWQAKLKVSEQVAKTTIPGVLQVRRFKGEHALAGDMIYDIHTGIANPPTIVDSKDATRRKTFSADLHSSDVLVPVLRRGKRVIADEPLEAIRERAISQLGRLHPSSRRFVHPHEYPVGIELSLHEQRVQMIHAFRENRRSSAEQGTGGE
jgi:nicotinate phosphoribosyltransferase